MKRAHIATAVLSLLDAACAAISPQPQSGTTGTTQFWINHDRSQRDALKMSPQYFD